MIQVPRWLTLGLVCAFAAFTVAFGFVVLVVKPHTLWSAVGLTVFIVAFMLCLPRRSSDDMTRRRAALIAATAVLLPILGCIALDPVTDSFSTGAWYISGVVCLVVQLLLHRRHHLAWIALGALVLQTLVWAGPSGLLRFGILATLLMIAVVSVSAWAIALTSAEIERYSDSERQASIWRAAQDAFHSERQVRIANTALVAAPMLRRITEHHGRLTDEDRAECRLLEQAIRDEIRGRRLLNHAVREQVMLQRRRGAIVQLNDDGGIDDLDPARVDELLNQVAEAIADLTSDQIIIRTASQTSPTAVTVTGLSVDPIAVALGLDDDEDRVDLWLELPRVARSQPQPQA